MTTEVEVSKKELKKLSRVFRVVSSRLLQTSVEQGMSNLKRFMRLIQENPIISDFIQKHQTHQYDIPTIWNRSVQWEIGSYSIPDESDEEEISFTFQLLNYALREADPDDTRSYLWLAQGYSGKTFKQKIDNFNKEVVQPLVNYIESYLVGLQIEAGEDDNGKVSITVYGNLEGGIMSQNQRDIHISNVADSNINAISGELSGIINNNITNLKSSNDAEIAKLGDLLEQLRVIIESEPNLLPDDKEIALEQVAVLADAGQQPKDAKKLKPVKTAIAALKGVAGALPPAAELAKAVQDLAPIIAGLLGMG